MLRIDSLYSYVDGSRSIGSEVNGISMLLAHIAVQEITTRSIRIGMGSEYLIAAGGRTDTKGIGKVSDCCLVIRTVAPCDGQRTIGIAERRSCRSRRTGISRNGHIIRQRIELGHTFVATRNPNLQFTIVIEVFGIKCKIARAIAVHRECSQRYRRGKLQIVAALQPNDFCLVGIKDIIPPV